MRMREKLLIQEQLPRMQGAKGCLHLFQPPKNSYARENNAFLVN